ncbi:helix-turn-helix domain-containing protein [Sulfitobacter sp. 1A16787]|uniref:helix-turn-helix domain-containing protein n=1 Tax=Sulfitobacter sp. 1A16787 TaxID=3368571 RepID=UPI0037476F4A
MTNENTQDAILDIARQNLRVAVALQTTNFSDVARKAGLSRNAVQQFVAGNTSISYANMLAVCQVLNIPIGLMHRPDAITPGNIRVHRALEALPDHMARQALDAARSVLGQGPLDETLGGAT